MTLIELIQHGRRLRKERIKIYQKFERRGYLWGSLAERSRAYELDRQLDDIADLINDRLNQKGKKK